MTATDGPLTSAPAWKALAAHHERVRDQRLRELFAQDPARGERLTAEGAGVLLDYSKQRVTDETLALLMQLARERGLRERIDAMFRGDRINVTEGRAVLHTALRAPRGASILVDGADVEEGPSNWHVSSGVLVDSSNIYGRRYTTQPFGSLAIAGDPEWTNYLFTGRMRNTDNDAFGVVFRYQDPDNFYRVMWSNDYTCDDDGVNGWWADEPRLRFDLIRDGELIPLDSLYFTNLQGEWYDFEVEALGETVAFWLDGIKLFEHTGGGLTHGAIGLLQQGSTNVYFDDLRVFIPEPTTLTLMALGGFGLLIRRRRSH